MEFPKLVIASDGHCTGALIDGISIGKGIKRLEFSADGEGGQAKGTIRVLELDVAQASLEVESETHSFENLMAGMTGIKKVMSAWSDTDMAKQSD